jgi:hypothetical protein
MKGAKRGLKQALKAAKMLQNMRRKVKKEGK